MRVKKATRNDVYQGVKFVADMDFDNLSEKDVVVLQSMIQLSEFIENRICDKLASEILEEFPNKNLSVIDFCCYGDHISVRFVSKDMDIIRDMSYRDLVKESIRNE